ncbi:MarR family winged helix-turn-helix transcriptional regulator [Streptomyces sp. NBC_01808]|nr:MarR family winged helix-turn-helix transcriptional regulator [Streptomyces sp. NBC_01808]WSA39337.1 MarR family winged helix-turn-helix transcriptional regulator [Streptomyces sp. NBC_01808]
MRESTGDGGADEDGVAALDAAALLDAAAAASFRLGGQFLARGDRLAAPAGLTAARWQVLYAVRREPLSVAGVARGLGMARQSVQRIADVLVADGLAAYEPNPAHRRAKLLRPTPAGRRALARLGPGHAEFAGRLAHRLGGEARFGETLAALRRLSAALEALRAEDAEAAEEAGEAGEPGGAVGGGGGAAGRASGAEKTADLARNPAAPRTRKARTRR